MRRTRALISAHQCLTRAQIERALDLGVDFVEFDVQRCRDGALVLHHDPSFQRGEEEVRLADTGFDELRELLPGLMTYDEALQMLAGRCRAHIDIKASATRTDVLLPAVARAVEVLGADGFVMTSGRDRAVRAIRDWGEERGLDLLAGLSLGRDTRGFSLREQFRIQRSELLPGRRVRHSGASVVVAHHTLALLGVARFARRHRLPLLVWTVDTVGSLRHWLRPGRAWLVTTNHPELALLVRGPERIHP